MEARAALQAKNPTKRAAKTRLLHDVLLLAAALALLGSAAVSLSLLAVYKSSPGAPGAAPATWPSSSQIPRAGAKATLLLFAHPMCACTRASLKELRVALSGAPHGVEAIVVFALPPETVASWRMGDNWRSAAAIPDVQLFADLGQGEGSRFGVKTSGQVVLYAADGRLLFQGGITGARGHEGENRGLQQVLAKLRGSPLPPESTPVFGCPLPQGVSS